MKKLILICIMSMIAFSCSNDDDINSNSPESIVDTTWIAVFTEDVQGVTVTITATMEFYEVDGKVDLIGVGSNGNSASDSSDFIYNYSNGNGTLSLEDSDVDDAFKVRGDILNVLGSASEGGISINGEDIDFIKQ